MRVKKFLISERLFKTLFGRGWAACDVVDGIPKDAILRAVRSGEADPVREEGRYIETLWEHDSFPELPEAHEIWDCEFITPRFHRYSCEKCEQELSHIKVPA